jgi:hypothetical protein
LKDSDDLYHKAVPLVCREREASTSFVQRCQPRRNGMTDKIPTLAASAALPRDPATGAFTRRRLLGGLALLPLAYLLPTLPVGAADAPMQLTSEDKADLDRIASYLDGLRTMQQADQRLDACCGHA